MSPSQRRGRELRYAVDHRKGPRTPQLASVLTGFVIADVFEIQGCIPTSNVHVDHTVPQTWHLLLSKSSCRIVAEEH